MDRRAEYVEGLIKSLESVLDALDSSSIELGNSEDPVMLACEEAFEAYRSEAERFASEENSPGLKERIQHAVKLHALLISGASREQDKIGECLEGSATRKQFRKAYKKPDRIGDSCDMAG